MIIKISERVKFPRSLSVTDEQLLLNQEVRYFAKRKTIDVSTAPGDYYTEHKYSLEILTGHLIGVKVEEEFTS